MARTAGRGYGGRHQKLRAQVRQLVDAGEAYCTEPVCLEYDRWIEPGSAWDLAHDRDAGPGMYRGPAHRRCNRSEGATYGNQGRRRGSSFDPEGDPDVERHPTFYGGWR